MARRLITGALAALAACGGPEWAHDSAQRSELQVCAGPNTVPGIDVSYYQGTIDWAQVAGAGYAFAITRINDGTFMDPQFGANWAGIKAQGLIRGAYQFWEPTDDPTYQANVVINAVDVLGRATCR
jgi:lysozyme